MRTIFLALVVGSLTLAQGPSVTETRDERVQVVLKNGHSLIGIARAGVRCEKLVRGNFKPCVDSTERASGIRVWYYQDLDGYIFLETRQLERVDVLGTLTVEESRALADAVTLAHTSRATAAPVVTKLDRQGEGDPESRPAPGPDGSGLTADERAILDQFPPDKGWSPEKFGELQRRKIVLHVTPTAQEQAFIDAFPSFQAAWKKWLATQPKQEAPPATDPASKPKR